MPRVTSKYAGSSLPQRIRSTPQPDEDSTNSRNVLETPESPDVLQNSSIPENKANAIKPVEEKHQSFNGIPIASEPTPFKRGIPNFKEEWISPFKQLHIVLERNSRNIKRSLASRTKAQGSNAATRVLYRKTTITVDR